MRSQQVVSKVEQPSLSMKKVKLNEKEPLKNIRASVKKDKQEESEVIDSPNTSIEIVGERLKQLRQRVMSTDLEQPSSSVKKTSVSGKKDKREKSEVIDSPNTSIEIVGDRLKHLRQQVMSTVAEQPSTSKGISKKITSAVKKTSKSVRNIFKSTNEEKNDSFKVKQEILENKDIELKDEPTLLAQRFNQLRDGKVIDTDKSNQSSKKTKSTNKNLKKLREKISIKPMEESEELKPKTSESSTFKSTVYQELEEKNENIHQNSKTDETKKKQSKLSKKRQKVLNYEYK